MTNPKVCPECQFESAQFMSYKYTPHAPGCSKAVSAYEQRLREDFEANMLDGEYLRGSGAKTMINSQEVFDFFLSKHREWVEEKSREIENYFQESIEIQEKCNPKNSLKIAMLTDDQREVLDILKSNQ